MQGKVALVTGAGAGIGQAIARRLAHEGAAVIVADINAATAADIAHRLREEGGQAAHIRADVAVEAEIRRMVAFAQERYGGLDILVNNAGIAPEPHFPHAAPEHWGRTLDVNLRGPMLAIQVGIQAMQPRGGGVIVNMSSMAAMGYRPYDVPEYAASKAALVRLTAALGSLHQEAGVRVNCICPGWVETAAIRQYLSQAPAEETARLTFPPPAVLIQPEDLAELVVMFIRDESLAGRVVVWPDGEPWRLVPL